jgi:carboxyl-terminal processing protease
MRKQALSFGGLALIIAFLAGFSLSEGGIGIKVRHENDGKFTIAEVVEGGPAESAGLFVGEEIKGIDGNSVSRNTLEEVVKLIRGEIGTEVMLTLAHASYPNLRNITVKRQALLSRLAVVAK